MRYGNATLLCMLSVGVVWGLSGGCGSSGNGSVFDTGTGGLSTTGGGSGTLTGGLTTGSTSAGIMTTTGGLTSGGSTGTGGGDACSTQASDSSAIPSDIFIMLDKSGSMNCAAADTACENP